MVCRRISTLLRSCAEYAFGECFLEDVRIDFQLEKYNLGGNSKRPEVPVRFDRLEKRDGKEIAWFKDRRSEEKVSEGQNRRKAQNHFKRVLQRWNENVKEWKPEMPSYTITIGDLVNDTALPGLALDIQKREINFLWKDMLHLFYREYARLEVMKREWHSKTAKTIQANDAHLAKGEEVLSNDCLIPWSTAEFEARKTIRRARLKEHYVDDEEMIWAIDSLRHFEQYGAVTGSMRALKLNVDLPGAGLGEKWYGSANLVQELYLDEWSCMNRIDTKIGHLRKEQA